MNLIKIILVITLLICAGYTSIKESKIPNGLTFSYILFGIVLNTYTEEFNGLFQSLIGIFVVSFVLIIPFILRILSGGDFKLAIALGSIKGPYFIFYSLLISFLIASIIYIFIKKGENIKSIKNAFLSLYYKLPINPKPENIPYAICLLISSMIILLIENYLPTPFKWTILIR